MIALKKVSDHTAAAVAASNDVVALPPGIDTISRSTTTKPAAPSPTFLEAQRYLLATTTAAAATVATAAPLPIFLEAQRYLLAATTSAAAAVTVASTPAAAHGIAAALAPAIAPQYRHALLQRTQPPHHGGPKPPNNPNTTTTNTDPSKSTCTPRCTRNNISSPSSLRNTIVDPSRTSDVIPRTANNIPDTRIASYPTTSAGDAGASSSASSGHVARGAVKTKKTMKLATAPRCPALIVPTNTAPLSVQNPVPAPESNAVAPNVFEPNAAITTGNDATAVSLLSLNTLAEIAVHSINKGVIPTSLSKYMYLLY